MNRKALASQKELRLLSKPHKYPTQDYFRRKGYERRFDHFPTAIIFSSVGIAIRQETENKKPKTNRILRNHPTHYAIKTFLL